MSVEIGRALVRPAWRSMTENMLWPLANKALWWRRLHRPVLDVPIHLHGDTARYQWPIIAGSLGAHSVIFSFGIGTNASFEEDLVAEYGCQVYAFDPTPRSVEWAHGRTFPQGLHFCEWGLAPEDGEMRFAAPADPTHVSYSALGTGDCGKWVSTRVRALCSIMAELRRPHLDLLKMDIEGCEYAVIDHLGRTDIRPDQLLVEFHQGFYGCTATMTRKAVQALETLGYQLFWVSDRGLEYGFIRHGGPGSLGVK